MQRKMLALSASVLAVLGGCVFLPLQNTTLLLVNSGSFPVQVTLYYGSNQLAGEDELRAFGQRIETTVDPGVPFSLPVRCDDLQAIFIDEADLQIIGNIGPQADTQVFRDGDDFDCGDTITFTFSHPALPAELNINFTH